MAWPPAAAKLVGNVAVPPAPTGAVPRTTPPSRNVTVPVGVPAPGATTATLAVKVTDWPVAAGLTDDSRATAVDARLTVWARAAEVLFAKSPVPAKEAVSAWLPTPSDTGRLAWPVASTCAVPSTVLPSRKVTVPVGVPAAEATEALSVTGWPKTATSADEPMVVVVAWVVGDAFTCSVRGCEVLAWRVALPL